MSLVSYAASSDEESDHDDDENITMKVELLQPKMEVASKIEAAQTGTLNGHISDDEDEDYIQTELPLHELQPKPRSFTLALPKPKNVNNSKDLNEEMVEQLVPTFTKLPMPRTSKDKPTIEEEDDEFLHKRATAIAKESLEKPPPPPTKGRVKITIPSLRDFKDVDKEKADKAKQKDANIGPPKGSGLLSLLPKAKSEQNFAKKGLPSISTASTSAGTRPESTSIVTRPAFIPDTVKNRRPAHNTEGVDGLKSTHNKNKMQKTTKITLVQCSESEGSDDENEDGGDFFSLNTEEKLPEVSANEINALVAKRAAKMVEATTKYLNETAVEEAVKAERMQVDDDELRQAQKRYHEQRLNDEEMQALVGANAKRRRKHQQDIQVIDISSKQVLPDRDEWMRTALTSSTAYQPTGVLNDEEPAAGTRRKHQITYLAHKAKSNEAELQAMWAANRQNRRAAQGKYGF